MKHIIDSKAPGAVTDTMLRKFRRNFEEEPVHRVTMNALTRGNLTQIGLNCRTLNNFDFTFSHEIEIGGEPLDQERAGTCWLFADTNWLRTIVAKNLNFKAFDFSQNHHEFYDKIEKANLFLEKMIEYRKRDMRDRHVVHLLRRPVSDGGDWLYTANCILKYGLVPKPVMPDTFNLKNSRYMNDRVAYKCRQGAMIIRELEKQGRSLTQMRKAKEAIMGEIYNLLAMFLGLPPERFSWSYRDDGPKEDGKKKGGKKGKKKAKKGRRKYHRLQNVTPKEFTKKYLRINPNDYVTLLHLPADGFRMNQPYVMEYGQNTVGASDMVFLNVEMSDLKAAAVKSIKADETVLYSSEAGPGTDAKLGYYHHDLFDYETMFNMAFPLSKAERITYFQEECNHLQLFIGVDLVDGKPVKWKLENSWGKQYGKNGLFMMSDGWFEEYVFTILVHKRFVPRRILNLYKKKPELIPLGAPFS
jgi:bleomycin hydrolase